MREGINKNYITLGLGEEIQVQEFFTCLPPATHVDTDVNFQYLKRSYFINL